jgi:hypothetical protein
MIFAQGKFKELGDRIKPIRLFRSIIGTLKKLKNKKKLTKKRLESSNSPQEIDIIETVK